MRSLANKNMMVSGHWAIYGEATPPNVNRFKLPIDLEARKTALVKKTWTTLLRGLPFYFKWHGFASI